MKVVETLTSGQETLPEPPDAPHLTTRWGCWPRRHCPSPMALSTLTRLCPATLTVKGFYQPSDYSLGVLKFHIFQGLCLCIYLSSCVQATLALSLGGEHRPWPTGRIRMKQSVRASAPWSRARGTVCHAGSGQWATPGSTWGRRLLTRML